MYLKRIAIYTVLALIFGSPAQGHIAPRDWENPAVFDVNQTEAHAPLAPFDSVHAALNTPLKQSPYVKLLNGTWKFHWASVPEESPADFYSPDYDISSWSDIQVPGCWQMQGFGHTLFRNVHQTFPANPPFVPSAYNPVGAYRHTFTLPATWQQRHIFLHFEGVKSASTVWINGIRIGYNQGGMEPAEYDITHALQGGENVLAVQVFRYCDGTYLEDQDMWRLAGIYRDVYLVATPLLHVRDVFISSKLDSQYRNATLKVQANIANYSPSDRQQATLRINLLDDAGKPVLRVPVTTKEVSLGARGQATVTVSRPITNPKKWSAEFPHLYTLVFELLDTRKRVIEAQVQQTGFRSIEVKNQAIYVNGVPITFNGVNSHTHHPLTGRTMDIDTMRRDLTLMKQFNINCVRTAHYPPNIEYLQLADELGLYVVDEAGDEAHITTYLSEQPAWRDMYIDRAVKMIKRDRNRPSVVIWSAGNESGSGDNIAALIVEGKKVDPSRPAWLYGGNTDLLRFEDIVGPRYMAPDELGPKVGAISIAMDARPSFMDEYLAATGNSLGMLDEYWTEIDTYPRLTGGAIWDWVSPGITAPVRITPDDSQHHNDGALFGTAQWVVGRFGKAVALSGHDDWIELYRDPSLDITGDQLTLSLWIYPRRWNGCGSLLTKGNHQYGLLQSKRDQIEFYIHAQQRQSAFATVPEDWQYQWHHLSGIYNGQSLRIYIDGQLAGDTEAHGDIARSPFAPAIGKNTELHGQEHDGELCNAVLDRVRIYNTAVDPNALHEDTVGGALVQLDFESIQETGSFYSLGIGGRSYGLVWPDRTIQPELHQLKKSPQPVKITPVDLKQKTIQISNRHHFKNLRELDCEWIIQADHRKLQSGTLSLDIPAQTERIVEIPFSMPTVTPGIEYRLLIRFTLAASTPWAQQGHEIAWEQLALAEPQPVAPLTAPSDQRVTARETDTGLNISGQDFTYHLDIDQGTLSSAQYRDLDLLKTGPRLNAFRAPTANETERHWGPRILADEWRACGLDRLEHRVQNVAWKYLDNAVRMVIDTHTGATDVNVVFINTYTYTVFPGGEILIKHDVICQGAFSEWIPRMGLTMTLPDVFNRLTWYGRGPFETYPDRKTGAKVGIYTGTVDEQYTPYLIPQDYGNKTDVRWASITNAAGLGWFVAGQNLLNISAQHFDTDHLDRAWYPFQLKKQDGITVNIDHRVSGVGGTPIKTPGPYRVYPRRYTYQICLKPFDAQTTPPVQLGRLGFPAMK